MNNDKAKRKLEIFDFVNGVAEKYDPKECLSLASSLLITTIAAFAGNGAAYDFSKCLKDLIRETMETLGYNVTVDVSYVEAKKMKCKYCGDDAAFSKKNDDGTVTYVCEGCVEKECPGVSSFSKKRCAQCGGNLNPAFMYVKPRIGDDFELGFCCTDCVAEYFGFEVVAKE